ncbi:hypothetical protein BZA70DRAFT_74615 [Myxozyma melibiosi]|uniref:C2H2-type domain-containing protein n=1 Tax=Myxozyma melibiosi TaxID=54550 RepID=A0ABR1F0B3_9ASCO
MTAISEFSLPSSSSRRRSSVSVSPYQIPGARTHAHNMTMSSSASSSSSLSFNSPPSSVSSSLGTSTLSRRMLAARRFSEGESTSGRLKEELKCEACGKGYKHISCLTKHLWEHTPEWNMTSKLLMSKHQQVQLLEAASILVSMTEEDELAELRAHHGRSSRENSADDNMYDEDDMIMRDDESDDVGVFGKMEE